MTLLHPIALALLGFAALIVILSILRTRQRRREVAALVLWDGLLESAPTRMTTLRYFIDLQLVLQLACLFFLVAALAEPIWHSQRTSSGAIAIVLDGSASMRTRTAAGSSRYEQACERAAAILDAAPSAPAAVLQLSQSPRVLAAPTADRRSARASLGNSSATFLSGGSAADLATLLDAVGGPQSYERILVFTDHALDDVPFPVSYELLSEGDNIGITAFSVRENLLGSGVSAFVEVTNASPRSASPQLTLRDEFARTTLDAFLEAGETAQFVVPFPVSRGTRFIASIDGRDGFPLDDIRYASLARSIELRVCWLGTENRFLLAALQASLPITLVSPGEPADLTVAYDVRLDAIPDGNVLLIHSGVTDVLTLGAPGAGGFAQRDVVADPLLDGIEAGDVFVERIEALQVFVPHRTLLSVAGVPLLVQLADEGRGVLALNSDLYATNLPITVDFPLLVRNFLASMVRLPGRTATRWNLVGQPVDLSQFGDATAVIGPSGDVSSLQPGEELFAPAVPGPYEVEAGATRFPMSVNLDPRESTVASSGPTTAAAAATDAAFRQNVSSPLWAYAAAIALALLVAEAFVAFETFDVWRKRRAT